MGLFLRRMERCFDDLLMWLLLIALAVDAEPMLLGDVGVRWVWMGVGCDGLICLSAMMGNCSA